MRKFLNILVPQFARFYVYFMGLTSRIRWINEAEKEEFEKRNKTFIYAFWHGRQWILLWEFRNIDVSILVSQSKDGELIAKTLALLGLGTTRGSSSRGGMKALVGLKRCLEKDLKVAITPDGPRGPQRTVAPGIIYLAQKTGLPILPVSCSAKRKLVFRGWDDYWIPLPFNLFTVGVGDAIRVEPDDNMDQKALELADSLNRITETADAWIGSHRTSLTSASHRF